MALCQWNVYGVQRQITHWERNSDDASDIAGKLVVKARLESPNDEFE